MPQVSHFRIFYFRIFIATVAWALLSPPSRADSPVIAFDIAAQPMAGALQALAEQADLQILFTITDVNAFTAPQVTGRMSSEDALKRLLDGTPLECVRNGDVLVIRERASTRSAVINGGGQGAALRLAQTEPPPTPGDPPPAPATSPSSKSSPPALPDATPIGETVVTGSWIRGAKVASPVTVLDRVAIERTGLTTVQQIVERLPQNYGGGDVDGTQLSPGGSNRNVGFGSSVNLRGLGADSTLVLLDGHRLAPASLGQYVDISMIPLTAIERIEVLTDGASAVYGSDAVAGVVNFKLRDDFEGAETRLKGGGTQEGHVEEYQFGQSFGHRWASGHALASYEYYERSNLDSNDRDFSRPALDVFDLFAEQERQSMLASVTQELSEAVRLRASALYSERDAFFQQVNFFTFQPQSYDTRSRQVAANLAGESEFGDGWQAELAATYGRSSTYREQHGPVGVLSRQDHDHDLLSGELTVNGSPFALAEAPIRLAVGAAWRNEEYDPHRATTPVRNRDVSAGFIELLVPLLGAASAQVLELSLAGRYESYSDFGDSTNPKIGLAWEPTSALRFRSTWGTSFRAPLLSELDASDFLPVLWNLADPMAADGTTLTVVTFGNNADLTPEEATTFTFGLDLEPHAAAGSTLSLTYFDTQFDERIVEPLPLAAFLNVFSQESIYASLITRDPDDAVVAALAAHPMFQNVAGPFVPADVGAIFDRRLQNLSRTQVRGIDLTAASAFETRAGEIQLGLDGTYLLDYEDQISDSAPPSDVLDTVYNLIDLRLRGRVEWNRGRWGASLYVNYADGYTNNTITPADSIASWTTVDLQLSAQADWLDGIRFALAAQNVFDEDPPFVSSPLPIFKIGYDPTNSSALGRFVTLSVTATW